MHASYHLSESLYSLLTNPLRSSLSILGVIFGVASVVAMLSIGMGAEAEIERLISALGAQNIHITSNEMDDEAWNRVLKSTNGLSYRDLQVIQQLFAGAPVAQAAAYKTADVNRPISTPRLSVYGMSPNYRSILGGNLAVGRSFTDREDQVGAPVAVLGSQLAAQWFGGFPQALGQKVRIDRAWFEIIGVLTSEVASVSEGDRASRGVNPLLEASESAAFDSHNDTTTAATTTLEVRSQGSNTSTAMAPGASSGPELRLLGLADAVIVPLHSATRRLGSKGVLAPLERLVLKLPSDIDPIAARKRLEGYLARLHRGADVVTVMSADEVIAQKRSTTRLFSYFLLTIAFISLVVGGIGIANVMLASMVERIREVGLRRAIGAKRSHILVQFLTEALAICMIGGLIGGLVGLAVAGGVAVVTGWAVAFPWWGLLVALVIATVVGTLAGLYPALAAARISPIEALQGRA